MSLPRHDETSASFQLMCQKNIYIFIWYNRICMPSFGLMYALGVLELIMAHF